MIEEALRYRTTDESYQGLLISTGHGRPNAAVVLLPDWRGQSVLARDHAETLVEQGCSVAIADLYGGGFSPTSPDRVGPMVQSLIENRAKGVSALSACVAVLRAKVGGDVPIFCLGYSAGGMIALDYGRSGADVAGIVVCSALLKTAQTGQSTKIKAPVLILQGTQDAISPMAVIAEVVAEMDAAENNFRLVLYGQTHHAFDNPEAGNDPTARLVYSAHAAADARRQIALFVRGLI